MWSWEVNGFEVRADLSSGDLSLESGCLLSLLGCAGYEVTTTTISTQSLFQSAKCTGAACSRAHRAAQTCLYAALGFFAFSGGTLKTACFAVTLAPVHAIACVTDVILRG